MIARRVATVLALVVSSIMAGPGTVRAGDDEVRQRVLNLNNITGEDTIQGEIKALVDEPVTTKKLLAVAVTMAKDKEQDFTYNAAYILARTAQELKDLETGRAFYRICVSRAIKLVSGQKLAQSYGGMIDLLTQHKRHDEVVKVCQEFLELPFDDAGMRAVRSLRSPVLRRMIQSLARQGQADKAMKLVEKLLEARPEEWRLHELMADIQREAGRHEEAVKIYEDVLNRIRKDKELSKDEMDELQLSVFFRLVQTMARAGQMEKASLVIEERLKKFPDQWRLHELMADVQREAGHYEQAAKSYESVLGMINKDKELSQDEIEALTTPIRYILSSVYVDLERVDKATEHLKALLAKEPDSPTFNNDLGYIWADHDMHLEEAERMIRKALDEDRKLRKADPRLRAEDDKDNAAYLDSLGWVLFKKKKHDEAKKYLLEAVADPEGQHVEVLDHLADVHLALGEKEQAVAVWKKALEVKTTSRREKQKKVDVEKKLKDNQ